MLAFFKIFYSLLLVYEHESANLIKLHVLDFNLRTKNILYHKLISTLKIVVIDKCNLLFMRKIWLTILQIKALLNIIHLHDTLFDFYYTIYTEKKLTKPSDSFAALLQAHQNSVNRPLRDHHPQPPQPRRAPNRSPTGRFPVPLKPTRAVLAGTGSPPLAVAAAAAAVTLTLHHLYEPRHRNRRWKNRHHVSPRNRESSRAWP